MTDIHERVEEPMEECEECGRSDRHRRDCAIGYLAEIASLKAQLQAEQERSARLRVALRSIAANGCCDGCQEAALVAKSALDQQEHERHPV